MNALRGAMSVPSDVTTLLVPSNVFVHMDMNLLLMANIAEVRIVRPN